MLELLPDAQLGDRALKVLHWILWDAHTRNLGPEVENEPKDRIARLVGEDLRAGAGLQTDNGYAGVRAALDELADAGSGKSRQVDAGVQLI